MTNSRITLEYTGTITNSSWPHNIAIDNRPIAMLVRDLLREKEVSLDIFEGFDDTEMRYKARVGKIIRLRIVIEGD